MKQSCLRSTLLAIAAVAFLYLPAAAQNADESAAWESIKISGSADQLKAFLDTFPTGKFAPEARQKYSMAANTKLTPEVMNIDVQFPGEVRRMGRSVGPIRVVKLDILVQQNGKTSDVKVATSSGFDRYDSAAVEAARAATYLPAMDHGMPVESRMDYEISFGLLCNRAAGSFTCDGGRFPQTCSATVCALLLR